MSRNPNALRWDGKPGHYEVYYLTLTDRESGVGVWIRYTLLAPVAGTGRPASCALWFVAIDPRGGGALGAVGRPARAGDGDARTVARKATFAIDQLSARPGPFELRIASATLSDQGVVGGFDDVAWNLRWKPARRRYEHVHPILGRLGVASTVVVLPHPDLSIDGVVSFGGDTIELAGARGGQAHLWGAKHASSWAWTNHSTFAVSGWRFEAADRARKLVCEVDADRQQLVGVTYHDPDGEPAYCYNSEIASIRVHVYERARQVGGWAHRATLVGPKRAHFEYGGRAPVSDLELLIT